MSAVIEQQDIDNLHGRIAALRWVKLTLTLLNIRMVPAQREHPLSVFDALIKTVTGQVACGPIVFHVPDRDCRKLRLGSGERFALEILFFDTETETVRAWCDALDALLTDERRNFTRIDERRIETCAMPAADQPPGAELCLEFLTPFPFSSPTSKSAVGQDPEMKRAWAKRRRTHLTPAGLLAAIERRVEALFHLQLDLAPLAPNLRVLCHFWEYQQFKHRSKSHPAAAAHTRYDPSQDDQLLNGCVGLLYLRGAEPIYPWLRLCAAVHLGGKLSLGRGYFRLSEASRPYFGSLFARVDHLKRMVERVTDRHEQAAAELASQGVSELDTKSFAAALSAELRNGSYRPLPSRATLAVAPGKTPRMFEELSFKDLVVQQALFDTLYPVIDKLLEPESVAYRNGHSRQFVAARIEACLRDGYRHVLRADIEDFYPTVDHVRLERVLRAILPLADGPVVDLIMRGVRSGFLHHGIEHPRERGLAQGAPLSNLLSNLYLDEFDERVRTPDLRLVRYADDFVIFVKTGVEVEHVKRQVKNILGELGLQLNADKTRAVSAEQGFSFLGMHFGAGGESHAQAELTVPVEKPLYIVESDMFLGINGEAMELRRHGKLREVVPLRRISEIVLLGRASLSSMVVAKCVQYNIPLTFTLSSRSFRATTFSPDSSAFHARAHRQAQRYESLNHVERLAIAKDLVAAKISNYTTLFRKRYRKGTADFIADLERRAAAVHKASSLDALRGMEGDIAKHVFAGWTGYIENPDFHYTKRLKKRPDRINSLLNFGYYCLFARINGTLRSLGINPYLGFLHDQEDRYETLTYDLMELFRACIDHHLLTLINLKSIRADHFNDTERGQRLTSEGIGIVIRQFETALARKPASGGLALGEAIYAQCLNLQRYLCDGQPLALYRWREDKRNATTR